MRDLCIMDALKKPLLILKILPPPVICSMLSGSKYLSVSYSFHILLEGINWSI